jgi:hypothetical protein
MDGFAQSQPLVPQSMEPQSMGPQSTEPVSEPMKAEL